jgi:GMP synthase (glutamine-hydrolysing)
MRVHAIYHVPFEGLGTIADWIRERGHSLKETHIYAQEALPEPLDFDMLILMGGPMNVNEDHLYPWLKKEKVMLKNAIGAGKRILGICLGAQLIALALNGRVFRNGAPEIGWFPVRFDHDPSARIATGPECEFVTFHWHGDTFDLPEKATRLAYSEATRNQAFLYDGRILAIQFHPEVRSEDIQRMIRGAGIGLKKDVYIQTADEMAATTGYFAQNQDLLEEWLNRLEHSKVTN